MKIEENEQLPITEQENPRAANLEQLSALEIVRLMNEEDAQRSIQHSAPPPRLLRLRR